MLELSGRPLAWYCLEALKSVFGRVAVVVKERSDAQGLEYDHLLLDIDSRRHPLAGVVTAIKKSPSDRVFVCACDLPLVRVESIKLILKGSETGHPTVATATGIAQPLLAVYPKSSLEMLRESLAQDDSMMSAIGKLEAIYVEVPEDDLFNVNTLTDLEHASEILRSRKIA